MKKLVMGSDHAGFALKEKIKATLIEKGYEVSDIGTYSTESCAYPAIAHELCDVITGGKAELGILICGTGVGMSMCANKHDGIRAACVSDTFSARLTRMHNDANVLCFGERVVGYGLACELVEAFITTEFEGGRHAARVDMINAIEKCDFEALK